MVLLKQLLRLAALCAVLGFTPGLARAQTAADSAGVLLGVATRLHTEGRVQLARSILDLIIERYPNTPAAQQALLLRAESRRSVVEQSGRTELEVFGTTYGLWLGVAMPAAGGADGPAWYGAGLIAGGPAGFGISRAYARSRSLSIGQARAITFGGTWGTWQGAGWANVFDFGAHTVCSPPGQPTPPECFKDHSPSGRAVMTSMVAGGLAGIGIGAMLSQKPISAGTATTVNFGGLWGTWYGAALEEAAHASGDNLTAALVGGDVGILATALLAPKWQLSRPRARLISIAGVAGLLAGAGILLIAQPEDNHQAILVPVATSTIGLALGARWTRTLRDEGAGTEGQEIGWLQPSVTPRVVERVRHGRLERVPVLGVTLLHATF